MTEPFESTFVLFVDMLGFADLVEQDGNELLNELNAVFNSIELYDPLPSASLLGYRFMNFHQCVNRARDRLEAIGNGTGIVFSDSAFFRIDDLKKAIGFARELMFDLVTSGPSRHNIRTRTWVTARNHRRITAPHTQTFNHGAALASVSQKTLVSG